MTARPPRAPASWSATRSFRSTARPITRSVRSATRSAGASTSSCGAARMPSRSPSRCRSSSLKPLPTFEKAIADSASIVERDGRKIGYIRLWTLAARRSMSNVAEALAEGPLKDADGLVLDLRGRWGGGSSDAAELFLGDTPPFRLIERNGEDMLANVRWRRPLVAIIDEGTRSGLEVFAYALKVERHPARRIAHGGRAACRPRLSAAGRQPARNRGFGCGDRRRRAPGRASASSRTCRSRSACPTLPARTRSARPRSRRCGAFWQG